MRNNIVLFIQKVLFDQRGQVLPWAALTMVAILGMAGLTMDVGHVYVVHAQLQNSTNAAALAAAGSVYIAGSSITTQANSYGANSGSQNPNSYVTGTPTVTPVCRNLLMPGGSGCAASGSNANPACLFVVCNAVKVTQTASVPTYFMRLFGFNHIALSTSAQASMGGPANKWNVAVIEDATGSMANADTSCPGSISQFQCALNGIQTLLANTNPCPTGMSTCTSSQANVRMALFSFPNIVVSDLPSVNACNGQSYAAPLPYQVHTLPMENATSYTPLTYTQGSGSSQTTWTASYEFTYGAGDADANGFVSDYYQSGNTTTGNLNPTSSIVKAVGYGGTGPHTGSGGTAHKIGCMPIAAGGIDLNGATNVGATLKSITSSANGGTQQGATTVVNTLGVGEGITYYASAIYAAQAALTAEAAANPGSQNAIILLSDGQANTQWIYFPQGSMKPSGAVNTQLVSKLGSGSAGYDTLRSTPNFNALVAAQLTRPNQEATGLISGLYPDFFDECQQAIVAAQYASSNSNAATQASRVYAVAYGAENSGCGTGNTDAHNDVTLVASGTNVPFSSVAALTPCVTMENIASSMSYFYSDFNQSGSGVDAGCVATANTVTDLQNIFFAISASLGNPKLLPINAT